MLGTQGAWASELDPHGKWVGLLTTGSNGNRQVLGNKVVKAGEKREDDFNVSLTTNSSIKILKFHFFQSFWEKERFILARGSPGVAELNC